jgi:predicted small metal-binding protein
VDQLQEAYRRTASQNATLFREAARFLRVLDEEGIQTLVLKGGALALAYYRDLGLRPMSDLDVLVRAEAAVSASDALERCGWSPARAVTPAYLAVTHAELFRDRDGHRCDLHWRLFGTGGDAGADTALWSAAVPLAIEGIPTRTLSPADHLLHVCVHGTRWARTPGIRWVADAYHILRGGGVDWSRLVEVATRRHLVLPVRDTLEYLHARMGASIPAEVLTRLSRSPVSALARLDYRIRSRPPGCLGTLPVHLCNYLGTPQPGHVRSPLGFGRYLQELWQLPSLAQLPRGFLVRALGTSVPPSGGEQLDSGQRRAQSFSCQEARTERHAGRWAMSKELRCGDLMPGCKAVVEGKDVAEVMTKATEHAKASHGMTTVPPDMVAKVKAAIRDK